MITSLLLIGITTNLFGSLSEQQEPTQSGQTESNSKIRAKIEVILLANPINFQQASLSLIAAAKNNQISGVIIIIDSGGGSTGSFSVLHDLIKKVSTIKPVIALVAGCACSGGYMIASAANYIFAHSFSDIGNIGVMMEIPKYQDAKITGYVEAKMNVELFTSGKFKALFNPYKALSDEDRAYIQKTLENDYQHFIALVAKNRNLNQDEYEKWADAKSFSAPEALQLGLIDEIGTIFEVESKMLELVRERNPGCLFDDEITTNLFPACTSA